jgi:hypothetical protein
MSARDQFIRNFRGEALGTVSSQSSAEEFFQNETLRPVLKLQNDILLGVFRNYITKSKTDFYHFTTDKKLQFIENSIQRDIKFRNSLKGIIIGLFTEDEFLRYIQNSSSLNKRMMSILIERLKSQVQLFELQV